MKTILIIEDDTLLNEALCKTFANAGYETEGACSMREALAVFNKNIDLMVIDIGLPDGDRLTLCRRIRQLCQTPVIFLTARDDETDMIRAFDYGADNYLVKPFSQKEYCLLELLARNRKKVITRQMMLEKIWDEQGWFVEENTVNVTLSRLKKKRTGRILTLYGTAFEWREA